MTERPDWRRRRWEATHQRIHDAALRLFQEQGFDRVNVGQIAAGAGVSVPTFYAHYPSKEHVVMQLPTREDMAAVGAALPAGLPIGERLKAAVRLFFASMTWTPELRAALLARWRIIASEPALRTRAAEFERITAQYLAEVLGSAPESPLSPADIVVVNAYMAAYTAGMLAWAQSDGERDAQDLVAEAFEALRGL
ncbi:MAG: transcriptional regulator, TetR family [Blastococcus sp.]|nr:transcriptional regulator, TetR family [Blastococcus sp.]